MQTMRTLRAAMVVTCAALALSPGSAARGAAIEVLPVPTTATASAAEQANRNPTNKAAKAAWIEAYRRLDLGAQTRQIEHLLRERIERGTLIAEGTKAAGALRTRHEEILQRVRAGKKLSDAGLEALLDDAASMERRAVERLARRYRIAVYEAFRTQRNDYDRFIEAWWRVEHLWQGAGSPGLEQSKLMAWLTESIRRFEQGKISSLPAKPQFDGPARDLGNPAKPERGTGQAVVTARGPAVNRAPVVKQLPAVERAPAAEPAPTLLSAAPGMKSPLIAPKAKPSVQLPLARTYPPLAAPPSTAVAAGETLAESPETRGETAAAKLSRGATGAHGEPAVLIAAASKPDSRPVRSDTAATVHAVNKPPMLPADVVEPAAPLPAPLPAELPALETAKPQTLAAPLLPPAPPAEPPRVAPPVAAPGPAWASVAPEADLQRPDSAAGGIDLMELQDRLSGYRVAVAVLNGRLQNPEPLNSAELMPLVETLDELITRRGDLLLYVKLVSDDTGTVQRLESPLTAVSLLSAKISAARQRIEGHNDDMLIARLHAELAALDQLSRRIAVLAAKLQEQR